VLITKKKKNNNLRRSIETNAAARAINNVRWCQPWRSPVRTCSQRRTQHSLSVFRLLKIVAKYTCISITMSWLFGSSNGNHPYLFPPTRAEYLRNAPVLHIRERFLTPAYPILYREKRRCPRASARSACSVREAQGMNRYCRTNKRKRLTLPFILALLRLQTREDRSRRLHALLQVRQP
jgi:hypothetical protein